MAELFTSDGDPQQPRPADDRAPREGASISIADVPEWVLARVDQVQYPTRMARRRALEAAQITDGWRPDPSITRPLLGRVEDELARLLDRRYVPQPDDGDIAQDPPALRAAPVTDLLPATAASRRVPKRWVAVALLAVVAVGAAPSPPASSRWCGGVRLSRPRHNPRSASWWWRWPAQAS